MVPEVVVGIYCQVFNILVGKDVSKSGDNGKKGTRRHKECLYSLRCTDCTCTR